MANATIRNPTDWANAFLGALGLPDTKQNVDNIVGWENSEGGNWHNTATFNPLDTTQREPGSHVMGGGNTSGVQAYTSWQSGLDATVQTISAGDYGYPGILDALSKSVPWTQFTQAVAASSWGGAGNKYLEQYATPPGVNSTDAPSKSTYGTGTNATTTTNTAQNSPSSTNNPKKLTGMAGILQSLDQMYNPDITGDKILGFIPNIPADSGILCLGIIAIGIHTLVSGSSSSGGGAGSNQSVIEFVNNAQIQNRKLDLSEGRQKVAEDIETGRSERNVHNNATKEKIARTPKTVHTHRYDHNKPRVW